MIKTIGLELKWLPMEIGSLFVDGGYDSLPYWYEAIVEKIKRENNTK